MRVAVLISGRGSNMKALVESCKAPASPANIVCVVSNRPHARGLDLAKQSGIEIHTVEQKNYPDRLAFEAELNAILTSTDIELVCLAGFMSLLTEDFVKRWHNRLINIHPSLLPALKGLNTHKRVLVSGVRISGCTYTTDNEPRCYSGNFRFQSFKIGLTKNIFFFDPKYHKVSISDYSTGTIFSKSISIP